MYKALALFLTFSACLVLETDLNAQDQGRIYFDKKWEETKTKSRTLYVRKWKKLGDEKYLINDHYLDGTLQMKAISSSFRNPLYYSGKVTTYFENGKVNYLHRYRNGNIDGESRIYYESGKLKELGHYEGGDREQEWIGFYEDSTVNWKGTYDDDQQKGEWMWNYKNGQPRQIGFYNQGKKVGDWKGYFQSGLPHYLVQYNDESLYQGEVWFKYENGNYKVKGQYSNDLKDGDWVSYYKNGQVKLEGRFDKGVRVGVWKGYYSDGSIEVSLSYVNGKLMGDAIWYHPSGAISVQEQYGQKKMKKVSIYDRDGKKAKSESLYNAPNVKPINLCKQLNRRLGEIVKPEGVKKLKLEVRINEKNEFLGFSISDSAKWTKYYGSVSGVLNSIQWESRVIMGQPRESIEYYNFLIVEGKLTPSYLRYRSPYTRYGLMPEHYEPELVADEYIEDLKSREVYTIVENMPKYPGGEEAMYQYLAKTVKYPPMAKDAGIQGIVYATFVVRRDGRVVDIRVLRGIGGGCDEEAIRVIGQMPKWKAGTQRGRRVSVQYNLPIRFILRG
ncbi:MAG: hypothetical protein CL840_06270 [Crocinitomicaceae bacterium]|nr:hypothetical protein [Crocinitomicaceae bacterium]|tara:strand:+ start:13823 stop:15493 length:1671 start_codon:yes stop_codon:yes gene_type:complete